TYDNSIWHLPWIIFDFFCVAFQFTVLVQIGFTYTFISVFGSVLINGKLEHIRRRLERNGTWAVDMTSLNHFVTEFTKVCCDIIYGNRELWSHVILSFLLTNIPPNVYLTARLILGKLLL